MGALREMLRAVALGILAALVIYGIILGALWSALRIAGVHN